MKKQIFLTVIFFFTAFSSVLASDVGFRIPDLRQATFPNLYGINAYDLVYWASYIVLITLSFSLLLRWQVYKIKVHSSMSKVSETIYKTCKAYLKQQGKFLAYLSLIVIGLVVYYLKKTTGDFSTTPLVIFFTFVGVTGSYAVAWYGIRLNTYANSRMAFTSLKGNAWDTISIPQQSGMSVGLFLISVELIIMVIILLFVPQESAGTCLLGFAIGESLSASVLRIVGGIFTKIADIGADLMKIIFQIPEDDPRNPGVIADCTGDNAGDSVGPTADGFETYGVTQVALIAYLVAATNTELQIIMIAWVYIQRYLMDVNSGVSYFIVSVYCRLKYGKMSDFDFHIPFNLQMRLTAITDILISYASSYAMLGHLDDGLWWKLSSLISCGTMLSLIIPELTKPFVGSKSRHVNEIVSASRKGGASLNILSGLVAGNYSAAWKGLVFGGVTIIATYISQTSGFENFNYAGVFALGLVAFGLLCMGPTNIAVDSSGPVEDNAQSVYELSQIEKIPGIKAEIQRDFGFIPNFTKGKYFLEKADGVGNTFKATAKPVLIGTAVLGSTTMIFALILMLEKEGLLHIELTAIPVITGFILAGATTFGFVGASIQAVVTGAYRAVEYIKNNLNLNKEAASVEDSMRVVEICTIWAQKGMVNIFGFIFSFTLSYALYDPNLFIAYLMALSLFGLYQAMFMADAGGAWDNAKKVVEVDLKEKNTELHEATVIGDTVGDPFKDTSSVALNPIIKFSTLVGTLAVEISVKMLFAQTQIFALIFFIIGLFFLWRSFYGMRIDGKKTPTSKLKGFPHEDKEFSDHEMNGKGKKEVLEPTVMNELKMAS